MYHVNHRAKVGTDEKKRVRDCLPKSTPLLLAGKELSPNAITEIVLYPSELKAFWAILRLAGSLAYWRIKWSLTLVMLYLMRSLIFRIVNFLPPLEVRTPILSTTTPTVKKPLPAPPTSPVLDSYSLESTFYISTNLRRSVTFWSNSSLQTFLLFSLKMMPEFSSIQLSTSFSMTTLFWVLAFSSFGDQLARGSLPPYRRTLWHLLHLFLLRSPARALS